MSWECILNKREQFRQAFDGFAPEIIQNYSTETVEQLMQNPGIVRNRGKILAAVSNAAVFLDIIAEHGNFRAYLKTFWDGVIRTETGKTHSDLSDALSKDLQRRGMEFVGTTILYSYLQAIGIVNSPEPDCFPPGIPSTPSSL